MRGEGMEKRAVLDLKRLKTSASPHLLRKHSSQWIMLQVIIALLFPQAAAIYFFGWRSLLMTVVGVTTAVAAEYAFQKISPRRKVSIQDLSAVVTGMLLALSLPVTAPLWTVVIGSLFAILVVKQLPGGLGRNRFNPAVGARVMLKLFFSPWITTWVLPGEEVITTATPLEYIGNFTRQLPSEGVPELGDLFLGIGLGGPIGETSKAMILLGMLYLLFRGVINLKIPLLYLLSIAAVTAIYGNFSFDYFMTHVLSGTVFFAATYMLTDYSSQPLTPTAKTVYAIGAGILTALFRILFDFPGGVGFSILIMNALGPWLDRHLAPRIYGHKERVFPNNPMNEENVM